MSKNNKTANIVPIRRLTKEQMDLYNRELFRIKKRLEAVQVLMGANTNIFALVAFENSCLQLRITLESVAVLGMITHEDEIKKWDSYHLQNKGNKIFEKASFINPDFYPRPYIPVRIPGVQGFTPEFLETGYLKREEFISLYDELGKKIHVENPYGSRKTVSDSEKAWIIQSHNKIKNLIQSFMINLDQVDIEYHGHLYIYGTDHTEFSEYKVKKNPVLIQ